MKTIFMSLANLAQLVERESLRDIANIVCFDEVDEETKIKCEARKLKLWKFWDDHSGKEEQDAKVKSTLDSIYTISQTSGSTGRSKLVMVPNQAIINFILPRELNSSPMPAHSILMTLPITHLYGKCSVFLNLQNGGKTAFCNDNPDYILRHMKAVGVTRFPTYPKVWIRFKEAIDAEISSLP